MEAAKKFLSLFHLKGISGLFIKIVIVIIAFVFLVNSQIVVGSGIIDAVTSANGIVSIVASVVIITVNIIINVDRWRLLLRVQGQYIGRYPAIRIVYTALFFGNFLPGVVGGDIVRLYMGGSQPGTGRGQVYLSVVVDKFVGLLSLLLLAVFVSAFNLERTMSSGPLMAAALFAAGGAAVLIVVFPLAGRVRQFGPLLAAHIPRLRESVFCQKLATHLMVAAEYYRRSPGRLACAVFIGILGHSLAIVSLAIVVAALNLPLLPWRDFSVVAALTFLANQVPLTPGGFGVGEAAFEQLCRVIASDQTAIGYGTAILVSRITALIASLPGAAAYLLHRDL